VIESKKKEMATELEKRLTKDLEGETKYSELPQEGMGKDALVALLTSWSNKDGAHWKSGQISGGIYHGGQDLIDVSAKAFELFAVSNPLHPDVFPMVRKMEAEVVQMTVRLFNGGPTACGTVTSGGTESILMAMKAYRDYALEVKGITAPEFIVPRTVHAAFDKAAHYFNMKIVHIAVDPVTFEVDVAAMAKAINKNTVALVGSAPNFSQGVIDPIEQIAALGLKHDIPVHVDCCLGSFCIAFAESVGHKVKPFDFRVPGVTSISADTHKYGFAPKGTSVVMYSDPKYRSMQYFVITDWPGGIYASPSIAGSRPGALIAGAWASMMYMGKEGYKAAMAEVFKAVQTIAEGVKANPYLKLTGNPDLCVVAFQAKKDKLPSVYAIADGMSKYGWHLNILQFPACLHIAVTFANAKNADKFVQDLNVSVEEALAHPELYNDGSAAFYGFAASLPDPSLVGSFAKTYLDTMLKA